ncbi:cell division protein ZapE [Nocardia sp. GAS34]|uniref:cell division protein ZapE n=1 Tax=unclassified Nocardia TaxID=2637762 RepID=UPI003D1C872D
MNESPILDADQMAARARLRAVGERMGARWHRPRGVYLYGRPGRGKTMLMDAFFADVAGHRKRRYHFHGFFAGLHSAVGEYRSIDDAIAAMLGDAELVCFDEFHVHDIGDAMLIGRLLEAAFARSITLVLTSNYPPEGLLPNPLMHKRFEPVIEKIRRRLDVVAVDGPRDYRALGARTGRFAQGQYIIGPAIEIPAASRIPIAHRSVAADIGEPDCLAADFAELCGTPLSAADYLELTGAYRRWTVGNVPELHRVPMDWATRFVNLVDVLYDADLPLTIRAAAPLSALARGVSDVPDLARTTSRLAELREVTGSVC